MLSLLTHPHRNAVDAQYKVPVVAGQWYWVQLTFPNVLALALRGISISPFAIYIDGLLMSPSSVVNTQTYVLQAVRWSELRCEGRWLTMPFVVGTQRDSTLEIELRGEFFVLSSVEVRPAYAIANALPCSNGRDFGFGCMCGLLYTGASCASLCTRGIKNAYGDAQCVTGLRAARPAIVALNVGNTRGCQLPQSCRCNPAALSPTDRSLSPSTSAWPSRAAPTPCVHCPL